MKKLYTTITITVLIIIVAIFLNVYNKKTLIKPVPTDDGIVNCDSESSNSNGCHPDKTGCNANAEAWAKCYPDKEGKGS